MAAGHNNSSLSRLVDAKQGALSAGVGGAQFVGGIATVGTLISVATGNVPLAITFDRVATGASMVEFALTFDYSKPVGIVAGSAMQAVVGNNTRYGVAAGVVYGEAVERTVGLMRDDSRQVGR